MNTPPHEYEAISAHNRKVVKISLQAFSHNALDLIGIPEQEVKLIGAAVGLATNGAKLNLNKSRTLTLELKDAGAAERSLYFGVSLDW